MPVQWEYQILLMVKIEIDDPGQLHNKVKSPRLIKIQINESIQSIVENK
jgi:hypothetical protein